MSYPPSTYSISRVLMKKCKVFGIEVKERIPDSVLEEADEVVNIDLTAEELITRLKSRQDIQAG